MAEALVERAPAKVNLDLLVRGRCPDGYHLLDSLAVFTALADRLTLAPADGLVLEVEGPFAAATPRGAGNLVRRAVLAMAGSTGRPPHVRVTLDKRIPVAAGIGGGSADAAAAMRGLRRLWHLPPDPARDAAIARRLGADVPACLAARPARLEGIGERLTPIHGLPALWLVLVNPGAALATADVFRERRPDERSAGREALPGELGLDALLAHLRRSGNDLEPAACRLCPDIALVLERLGRQEGCLLARMSGSGATCFGLFGDRGAAERAALAIRQERPLWWVAAAGTADRP